MRAINEEVAFLTSANLCRWIINFKQINLGKQIGALSQLKRTLILTSRTHARTHAFDPR
jgi:hypothetical protein